MKPMFYAYFVTFMATIAMAIYSPGSALTPAIALGGAHIAGMMAAATLDFWRSTNRLLRQANEWAGRPDAPSDATNA